MKASDCCVAMDCEKPQPSKYTQGRDWSMEGNRPVLHQAADQKEPTTNKPAETGLIVRQPL